MFGRAALLHTEVDPLMLAVGKGLIVTVALPLWDCEHAVELASVTLTSAYVNVPEAEVGTNTVTLFPELVVTSWLLPLFIV